MNNAFEQVKKVTIEFKDGSVAQSSLFGNDALLVNALREECKIYKSWLEWKPIETAPKDGTWILVYKKLELNGFNKIVWETDKFIVRWHNNGWYKNNGLFTVDNITHWINLPKTPEL
jgi:hypothetical protein